MMYQGSPYPPVPQSEQVGVEGLRFMYTQPIAPQPGYTSDPYLAPTTSAGIGDKSGGDMEMEVEQPQYYSSTRYDRERGMTRLARALVCLWSLCIWVLNWAAHLEMSCAAGRSGNWLLCLVPVLIGPLVISWVCLLFAMIPVFFISYYEGERGKFAKRWMIGIVWFYVAIISCGIPYGMTCGQQQAAADNLVPSMQKELNVWRNPTESVTTSNTAYITTPESAWKVAYGKAWLQKMETQSGTEDDGDADQRYNYCVAPIQYTGKAPGCTINLWAACFVQTTLHNKASCDASAAATCGWDFPANTVIMRVVSWTEEFFNVAESSDETDLYYTAVKRATVPTGKQQPVVVLYGDDGPDAMVTNRDTAQASIDIQQTLFYIFFTLSMAIHSVWLYKV